MGTYRPHQSADLEQLTRPRLQHGRTVAAILESQDPCMYATNTAGHEHGGRNGCYPWVVPKGVLDARRETQSSHHYRPFAFAGKGTPTGTGSEGKAPIQSCRLTNLTNCLRGTALQTWMSLLPILVQARR